MQPGGRNHLGFSRSIGVVAAVTLALTLLAACEGSSDPPSKAADNPPTTATDDVASGDYELVVDIDAADVAALESANQQVVVVRPLEVAGTTTNVAWTTVAPAATSEITWGSDLYAFGFTHGAQPPFEVGDVLLDEGQVKTDVSLGDIAYLDEGATPEILQWTTSPSGPEGALALQNRTQYECAIGLGGEISVNGSGYDSPFFVLTQDSGNQLRITPIDTVQVFIGDSDIEASQVIGPITAPTLEVDLASNPSQTISYDSSTGAFVAAS